MKGKTKGWFLACLVLLLGAGFAAPAMSADTGRAGFTEADAEYYMSDQLFFFIRPGLDFHLISFEIPSDRQPLVTFKVTDPGGYPLDMDGVYTPGPIDIRFMLSYIPAGQEQKVTYHDADNGRGRDRTGFYTAMGDGMYTYKFGTVLPSGYEADSTHTLVSSARRSFSADEFDGLGLESSYYDSDLYNFVPSGDFEPMPRDIVADATCNRCHDDFLNMAHGTRYGHVQACQNCHNPEYMEDDDYSLNSMIHRIHASNEVEVGEIIYPAELNNCQVCHTGGTPTADMPLAVNPNPIPTCDGSGLGKTELVWGADDKVEVRLGTADGKLFTKGAANGSAETGKWVTDGMDFVLVDSASGDVLQKQNVDLSVFGCVSNPPYAAYGEAAAMHSNWLTRPSRLACTGCHIDINWETGENHAAGPQEDDDLCGFCHKPDTGVEFDRSIKGAHTLALASSVMTGVLVTVKSVSNTAPGQHPKVVFSLSDEKGPLNPASLETFTLTLNGPNDDFEVNIRENALGKVIAAGSDWSYTFSAAIPADAEGSYSVGYEGRISRDVNGVSRRDATENSLFPIAVTDSAPVARRQVVDDAKCESCHSNLSLHGDNRKNANEYCQTCHNPEATDEEVRTAGIDESIHFKYMIHKIHRGEDLQETSKPYIIYGYRSSVHDYSDVVFPGDLRNCEACHVNDSYELPLPEGALPTNAPSAFITEMEPITAACLSCHDSFAAAAHADANTGGLGESCEACHGENKTYAVSRVHAR